MSAQKALQGSETESREFFGGMEENSVSQMKITMIYQQANQLVFTKKETEKN